MSRGCFEAKTAELSISDDIFSPLASEREPDIDEFLDPIGGIRARMPPADKEEA